MKPKLRLMVALLALMMALTACQPTPEAEPVIQKDTEKLIEMATTTATPEADTSSAVEESTPAPTAEPVPLSEQFGERFTVDFTANKGARVVGDVKIRYLSEYAFPMYRMKKALPEGEKVRELAKRLFGSEEVYIVNSFETKAEIKKEIDDVSSAISNKDARKQRMEEFGETEEQFEQWLAGRQERLRELQEKYNSMTGDEERPLFEAWDGVYSEGTSQDKLDRQYIYLVDREDNFKYKSYAQMIYRATDDPYFSIHYYASSDDGSFGYNISEIAEDWSVPCGKMEMTPQEAADAAVALFDGILDVRATEVRWGGNGSDTSRDTDFAYTVLLAPVYDGATAVYTRMSNSAMEEVSGGSYMRNWSHEQIEVSVNEKGIRSCSWSGHMEVQEKLTENVNLLDFDTIYALFTQQMNRKLATEDASTNITMLGVSLGLMRIREEDSPYTALLVPVWYFRGLEGNQDYAQEVHSEDSRPLCVLNAIDGSVINTYWGY